MKKLILISIIFIAAFLRFYQLGINPPSLTWDEVAWGYNAYSLGIDGKDEFGRFLPLDYLESFGDFKPPVYAYLDVLPVKLFGLNEFAVRFPSALFGVLTILITYFLVKRIFKVHGQKQNNAEIIALLAAFLLAISPWHINLSRAAFEANVSTFFLITGVWLFLKGIQDKRKFLVASVAVFVLALYTFNSTRIVGPLLVVGLATVFRKQLLESKKETFIAIVIGLLMVLPTFKFLLSDQASLRFREVNIFSDISVIEKVNQEIQNDNNASWSKILHNRRFAYGIEFAKHYFDNLNPNFLFIKGDGNPKFSTQDVGELYIWEIPFLIIGILYLFKNRTGSWWIIPFWLLVGIIPASMARETPHALRIEAALPTFQILVAYGLFQFLNKISNIRYQILNIQIKYFIFTVSFLFLIFNFLYYLHGYYANYAKQYSGEWQYGYKEAISYIKSVEKNYDKVYFTETLGRPYIYFLFYNGLNPKEFRKSLLVEREVLGFVHVNGFSKYRFSKNIMVHNDKGKILYVDTTANVPKNAKIQKEFYLLNGEKVLAAYIF